MSAAFLKVPTMLRAMFRRVEGAHSPRLYVGAPPSPTAGLREEVLNANGRPEILVRFLAEMDRKLDAVLALLQRESLHEDFPLHGRVVELSGAGACLECQDKLDADEHIEVLLLLEEYPVRAVSTLAVVTGSESGARTGPPNTAYQLSFVDLEKDDREHIIRFVFSEERKRIRKARDEGA
ncbi:PilZ domain-containing protein [Desulfovibrio sp. OttesenSCG-928-M16]|nr:PilZ domain-containing protein [Desulfovibrio sp. OttesenSCG-928-M16]